MSSAPRDGLPTPRIVFSGRFSPDKGPDVLIDAVARMAAPPPVLMLGAGVLEGDLRAQVIEAGLEDVVSFRGWIEDPGPWVAGAAVQVCPSRDESFSQTAVLAMALGVPVVGTDVDGFPETLADGRGVIVPADDPAALATALEGVLGGALRTKMFEAQAWARQFEVGRVADVYEQAYAEFQITAPPELVA
jgi:glycosyltransferase involved in cell wall biosynthesis